LLQILKDKLQYKSTCYGKTLKYFNMACT